MKMMRLCGSCNVNALTRVLTGFIVVIAIQIILFVIVFQRLAPDKCLILLTAKGMGVSQASDVLRMKRVQLNWRFAETNITNNLQTLSMKFGSYWQWKWMRRRVEQMWPEWVANAKSLAGKETLRQRIRKRILVIPGVLMWTNYAIPIVIKKGGPLGDLVQWSDLIAGLHVLGHDVTLTHDSHTAWQVFEASQSPTCREPFDLIYMDILAAKTKIVAKILNAARCRVRIVDAYGTEAMYNHLSYAMNHNTESPWGGLELDLKQFYTFYPHTPDNSFLGFAVSEVNTSIRKQANMTLLYGKSTHYLKGEDKIQYLKLLTDFTEVHATMSDPDKVLPKEVHNHGILDSLAFQKLTSSAKVLIGLGEPLESTGVMVALASGCIFINPKFTGEMQDQLKGKPTSRKLTSQVPYLENFIGPPYVHTVDIRKHRQVIKALKTAMTTQSKSFIPREFQIEGFLQRLNAYIENQQFCDMMKFHVPHWPPKRCLRVVLGPLGISCAEACQKKGLVCERAFFNSLDATERLKKFICDSDWSANIFYPAYRPSDRKCLFQKDPLLFSCVGSRHDLRRLCPCRTFIKHQVALC